MVAVQTGGRFVQRHPGIAVGAVTAPAAVMTQQSVGKPAAIEKHQYLLTLREGLLYAAEQFHR